MTIPTVLVISDDDVAMAALSRAGETAGVRVLTVRTARAGLEPLRDMIERAASRDIERAASRDIDRAASRGQCRAPARSEGDALDTRAPLPTLSRLERDHVLRALERAMGNKKAAAAMLGVSRRAFYRRLERLSLGRTIARRRDRGVDAAATSAPRPAAEITHA